jgi:hypothetical protein
MFNRGSAQKWDVSCDRAYHTSARHHVAGRGPKRSQSAQPSSRTPGSSVLDFTLFSKRCLLAQMVPRDLANVSIFRIDHLGAARFRDLAKK